MQFKQELQLTTKLGLVCSFIVVMSIVGCGGSSSGSSSGSGSHTIGGTVTGLTGSLVLQNNSGDDLSLAANGNFTFATSVATGGAYSVSVLTQPSGQACSVSSGAGKASANIGNVAVVCSTLMQMGGARQGATLNLTSAVSTLAGSGTPGATDNTNGLLATFNYPSGITTDGVNLYVADYSDNKIRQIVIATGAVTTLAGSGSGAGTDNANGLLASFADPADITTDGTNLYVVDTGNNKIRKIVIATGAVTTLAGSGAPGAVDNADGLLATFRYPSGITTDGINLYVADTSNNTIRQIVIATGAVTTLAGSGATGAVDNTNGLLSTFFYPEGITTDGVNLYVADWSNNKIRRIVIATGAVTTLAGSGTAGATDNTNGLLATFNGPVGVTSDGSNLYVVDQNTGKIRQIVIATGAVTTLGLPATFFNPQGITTDGFNLYVADMYNQTIRRIK